METKKTLYGRFWRLVCTVALILSVLTAFQTPAQAVANSLPKFISEMILIVKDTLKEAKQTAESQGYFLMETPIYDANGTQTYIAYKTTTNPNKAIKKIKAMNMYGDWNFAEYQNYLENQKSQVNTLMTGIKEAIAEYAEMCNDKSHPGNSKAIYAKTVLNYLYDDDTKMNIGDLFLLPVMTDEEATKSGKNKGEYLSETHLLEILLQSNVDILATIESALLMACSSYNNNSFLKTISSSIFTADSYKDSTQYSSAAQDLLFTLADTQKILYKYTKSGYVYSEDMLEAIDAQMKEIQYKVECAIEDGETVNIDTITKEVRENFANRDIDDYMDDHDINDENAAIEALKKDDNYINYRLYAFETERDNAFNTDNEQVKQLKSDYGKGFMLFKILYDCKYKGYKNDTDTKNLYDLVSKHDLTVLEPDESGKYNYPYSLSDFYPIVAAMSNGERGLLKLGFYQVITAHTVTAEDLTDSLTGIKKDLENAIREYTEADLKLEAEEAVENGTSKDATPRKATETELSSISIYANVDRSLFDADSDIAMTGTATKELELHPEKQLLRDEKIAALDKIMMYVGIASAGLLITEMVLAVSFAAHLYNTAAVLSALLAANKLMIADKVVTLGVTFAKSGYFLRASTATGGLLYANSTFTFSNCLRIVFNTALGLGKSMISLTVITIGILLICVAVWLIMKNVTPEADAEYLKIPRVLCSHEPLNEKDENGEPVNDYVYYYGVRNPEIDTKSTDPSDNVKSYGIQDIYNWSLEGSAREWIALYTTTDNAVGAPILADSLKVSKSSIMYGDSYTPVESFAEGERGYGYNLLGSYYNAAKIGNGDGLYLHYQTDTEAFARFGETPKSTHNTASVFANWDVVAGCAISLLVGIGGGIGISYLANKRRKKKANNA